MQNILLGGLINTASLAHQLSSLVGYQVVGKAIASIFVDSSHVKKLKQQVIRLKQTMDSTSAQDEFAKWAKLRRQYDKLSAELDAQLRIQAQNDKSLLWSWVIWILLWSIQIYLVARSLFQPMFYLPLDWFGPIASWTKWPLAPHGSVSSVYWWFACNSIISRVLNALNKLSNSLYTEECLNVGMLESVLLECWIDSLLQELAFLPAQPPPHFMSVVNITDPEIKQTLGQIHNGSISWMILGYKEDGSSLHVCCTGTLLQDLIYSLQAGPVRFAILRMKNLTLVQSIPAKVDTKSAFALIHGRKIALHLGITSKCVVNALELTPKLLIETCDSELMFVPVSESKNFPKTADAVPNAAARLSKDAAADSKSAKLSSMPLIPLPQRGLAIKTNSTPVILADLERDKVEKLPKQQAIQIERVQMALKAAPWL